MRQSSPFHRIVRKGQRTDSRVSMYSNKHPRNQLTLPVVGGVLVVGGLLEVGGLVGVVPVPAEPTVISAEPLLW
jgi:hypothetical protein